METTIVDAHFPPTPLASPANALESMPAFESFFNLDHFFTPSVRNALVLLRFDLPPPGPGARATGSADAPPAIRPSRDSAGPVRAGEKFVCFFVADWSGLRRTSIVAEVLIIAARVGQKYILMYCEFASKTKGTGKAKDPLESSNILGIFAAFSVLYLLIAKLSSYLAIPAWVHVVFYLHLLLAISHFDVITQSSCRIRGLFEVSH